MNKQFTKALALGLAAMMVLGGCGGASTETKAAEEASAEKTEQQQEQTQEQQAGEETKHERKEVVIPVISTEEIETFNFLHSQRTEDSRVLVNLWDGLLTSNSRGEIVAGIADEWGTEDGGLTWKFHLRDGVKWVDVNANEKPYFEGVATSTCVYPLSQALVDELGVDGVNGMNNENMWYNGAYTLTSYIQGNEKIFTKNPKYWDADSVRFDTATHRMVESWDTAYQLYQAGEVDYVKLTESMIKTISENPNHEFYKYMVPDKPSSSSYQMHWNYAKNKEDGTVDTNWNTAIANEAFRKSIYYGLDLTGFFGRFNALEPLQCENNAFTCRNLVRTSDGTDYVDRVEERLQLPESNGETPRRYDPEKAAEYKKQAMEELSALGVTFPVEIDYYIAGSDQTKLDNALVLQNSFENGLGSDYVKFNIKTYISSLGKEVREPRLHSFIISGWSTDYNDPKGYLDSTVIGNDNAWYADSYSNINKVEENETNKALLDSYRTYTEMVEKADAITKDMDARYEAFADAEAYTLEKAHMLPCYYNVGWCLTRYNVHAEFSGSRMKNWETKADGYTVDEVKAILAAQGK